MPSLLGPAGEVRTARPARHGARAFGDSRFRPALDGTPYHSSTCTPEPGATGPYPLGPWFPSVSAEVKRWIISARPHEPMV